MSNYWGVGLAARLLHKEDDDAAPVYVPPDMYI